LTSVAASVVVFQAAGAAYENARLLKFNPFNRVRGCSYRSLLPDRSRDRELMVAVRVTMSVR